MMSIHRLQLTGDARDGEKCCRLGVLFRGRRATERFIVMPQDTPRVAQYRLRWVQRVQGGTLHWYLRRLASDLRFWGYVHIRTSLLSENRSFDGVFPEEVWRVAVPILRRIHEAGNAGVTPTEFTDGAMIVGDYGTANLLISCNVNDRETSAGAAAFYGLVEVLQPHVTTAARFEERHKRGITTGCS